jgi:hypothetical protein
MIRVTFSTPQQQVTMTIICDRAGLDKHHFPNNFIDFFYCQVENVARIMHHTSMFAWLQYPRASAGRNISWQSEAISINREDSKSFMGCYPSLGDT